MNPLAVDKVTGSGASMTLSRRCRGTDAIVVRSYLHPVSSSQERLVSVGAEDVPVRVATGACTTLGVLCCEAQGEGGRAAATAAGA